MTAATGTYLTSAVDPALVVSTFASRSKWAPPRPGQRRPHESCPSCRQHGARVRGSCRASCWHVWISSQTHQPGNGAPPRASLRSVGASCIPQRMSLPSHCGKQSTSDASSMVAAGGTPSCGSVETLACGGAGGGPGRGTWLW